MQLDGIRFGIWESEDVVRRSVVEIVHGRSFSNGKVVSGGPFDERLGTWRNLYDKGKTCGESGKKCPGHFGHFKYCANSTYSQVMYQISFSQGANITFKPNDSHPTGCGD